MKNNKPFASRPTSLLRELKKGLAQQQSAKELEKTNKTSKTFK